MSVAGETAVMGCPDCGQATSFNLPVSGTQVATYVLGDDNEPELDSAGHVEVHDYPDDALHCRNCGAEVSESDLVVVAEP